ncbi:pyridoxamine 5'-phosphate oxidase family protein [Microbacterium sp. NPDC090225]|uniref:pyridoxamine 5'-phosphate oxidase family protein n=1 Tax=Microbacterium sp. NPDC090225 TaxID=3364207 RepID=UPI003823D4F8
MATAEPHPPAPDALLADLDEAECWRLLEATELCRLAFTAADGRPDIRPVNHLAVERSIYIRSAADAKFLAVASPSAVALEVDGETADAYWSVVVRGEAEQVTSESELYHSGVEHLASWTPTPKQFVVKVASPTVTGRVFPKRPRVTLPVYAVPLTDAARAQHRTERGERPSPIPHFEPPAS